MAIDLHDLVDNPRESLDIELKQWLDLTQNLNRANLARHIAALCNHGGGYIVFGFCDDASVDLNISTSLQLYDRDTISSIVKHYLAPSFECHVTSIESNAGNKHTIIQVPGHGSVPVCSQKGGPHDEKGRPQGIRPNTYYVRALGPESTPITMPDQWMKSIRRCTLNDRDTLLREMNEILHGHRTVSPSSLERLENWDKAVNKRYTDLVEGEKRINWPLPLSKFHYQLSYLIVHNDEPKPIEYLRNILEEINNEVRDTVYTGWSMFYPFTVPEISPKIFPENSDGTGLELLEENLTYEDSFQTSLPDFWRVSPDGRASIVRGYREDYRLIPAGKWLAPITVLRETAELVRHARAYSRRFPSNTEINFLCTWVGLQNREIGDFDTGVYWRPGKISAANKRVVRGSWSTSQISADWPQVVAELGCPVLNLFGVDFCNREFIRGMAQEFKSL